MLDTERSLRSIIILFFLVTIHKKLAAFFKVDLSEVGRHKS